MLVRNCVDSGEVGELPGGLVVCTHRNEIGRLVRKTKRRRVGVYFLTGVGIEDPERREDRDKSSKALT